MFACQLDTFFFFIEMFHLHSYMKSCLPWRTNCKEIFWTSLWCPCHQQLPLHPGPSRSSHFCQSLVSGWRLSVRWVPIPQSTGCRHTCNQRRTFRHRWTMLPRLATKDMTIRRCPSSQVWCRTFHGPSGTSACGPLWIQCSSLLGPIYPRLCHQTGSQSLHLWWSSFSVPQWFGCPFKSKC
jgi:hypothetical protein